jgi:hypothetical protein
MDLKEKQLDFAKEAITQQITLATAVIGASLAFSDQIAKVQEGRIWELLPYSFAPLALSIVAGVLALLALSYELGKGADPFRRSGVRLLGVIQNFMFLASMVGMVIIIAVTG